MRVNFGSVMETGVLQDQLREKNIYMYNIILTSGFHVAVHLFSNRSQMTSKCGKTKEVAH